MNGNVIDDQKKIAEEVLGFFYPLFNGHHSANGVNTGTPFVQDLTHLQEFLKPLSKLDDTTRDSIEKPFEMDELEEAIKDTKPHKSPGLDGIPYEWYKKCFPYISEELLSTLNSILDRIKLTKSQEDGATRLLSKVDGIPQVDELRPITLLNSDYKLLTKILVNRILPLLPLLIKSGQLASVDGKQILFGVANIISAIEYVNQKKIGAALVSLDQWKAYDRTFIPFLLQVLAAMNFGPKFIAWIEMLHRNISTKFILNVLTDPIALTFSLRQGDPIAMIGYILYIEPLLMMIKTNIQGLKIANINQIDEDFVDDVNILVESDEDFLKIDQIFSKFEKVSGAILNRSHKSKVMGLGKWEGREDWPLKWLKVVSQMKIFGFIFTPTYSLTIKLNWEDTLEKLFQQDL